MHSQYYPSNSTTTSIYLAAATSFSHHHLFFHHHDNHHLNRHLTTISNVISPPPLSESWKIQMKIPMEKFSLVECSELYQQNSSSPCLLVNTDEIFLSVYTEGITMGKEGIKKAIRYNDVLFL